MRIGSVVTSTNENPLYYQFVPNFVKAWKAILPEARIRISYIGHALPAEIIEYSEYIDIVKPLEGVDSAFYAQCIRLLAPRSAPTPEGVLITDMDMIPLCKSYYLDPIAPISNEFFISYRDVLLPDEIAMCYNVALASTWEAIFGRESYKQIIGRWFRNVTYDGRHGGAGWNTDQRILLEHFNAWSGPKLTLNDGLTNFRRLDRDDSFIFYNHHRLAMRIKAGLYSDYHCQRPYHLYKLINDYIVLVLVANSTTGKANALILLSLLCLDIKLSRNSLLRLLQILYHKTLQGELINTLLHRYARLGKK